MLTCNNLAVHRPGRNSAASESMAPAQCVQAPMCSTPATMKAAAIATIYRTCKARYASVVSFQPTTGGSAEAAAAARNSAGTITLVMLISATTEPMAATCMGASAGEVESASKVTANLPFVASPDAALRHQKISCPSPPDWALVSRRGSA